LAEAEPDPEDSRRRHYRRGRGVFRSAKTSAATIPPTAWPYGIPEGASLNATYNNFRDADRKDISGANSTAGNIRNPIIGAVSG